MKSHVLIARCIFFFVLMQSNLVLHAQWSSPSTYDDAAIDSVKQLISQGGDADKLAQAYASLAYYYRNRKPDELSYSCIRKVISYIPEISLAHKPEIYLTIAITYREKAVLDKSLLFAKAAAAAAFLLNDTAWKGQAYHNIGNVYSFMGEKRTAIEYYYKAISEHEKFGKGKPMGTMLALAGLWSDIGEHEKAITMYDEVKPTTDTQNYERMARLNEGYGVAYTGLKQWREAIEYLNKALYYKQVTGDKPGEAFVNGTLAENHAALYKINRKQDHLAKAFYFYRQQLKLTEDNNVPVYFVAANMGLGALYLQVKQLPEALHYSRIALDYAEKHQVNEFKTDILKNLQLVYHQLNQDELAYDHLLQYMQVKDSIVEQAAKRKLIEEELKLDYANKAAANRAEFEQKEMLMRGEQKLQVVTRNAMIVTLFFASLLMFTIVAFNHQRKLKNSQQEFTQRLITLQEEERKSISKELHDGIGQNLLVIGQQLNDHQGLISTTLEELRHIARNLHPVLLEKLGFKKAIESVILDSEAGSDIFFSHDIEDADDLLNEEQQINLYRIVQECISNIIKHSKAADARITFTRSEKYLTLQIEDNGIGFDQAEAMKRKSIGLVSLKERVSLLDGNLDIDSSKNGTRITIRIKHG